MKRKRVKNFFSLEFLQLAEIKEEKTKLLAWSNL